MAYLIAINRSRRNKLPQDATPAEWARYNDAFENVELSAGEIADAIRAGYAIAPQCDGRRKRDNWRLAQHVGVDFDNGAMSWDDLVRHPLVESLAAIVHTTASHTAANPRYRVLFLLSEPVRQAAQYTRIVAAFLAAFRTADAHCKDPARLFFGAADCSLLLMPANVVTTDDLAYILATWPDAVPPVTASEKIINITAGGAASHNGDGAIIPPADLSPVRRAAHLAAMLDKIHMAPDGTKWATLRDVSITLGGYAAGGYYTASELQKALRQAIETRRATVASLPAAYDTIDRGLAYGAMRPLYYTSSPRLNAPPPDGRGRLRWLLDTRRQELEAAIEQWDMAADTGDFEGITREYAIIMRRLATD